MSDTEDENYVTFGNSLDPLDEENLPRKKPVTIEDQYAYDAQGRRRFHGAFTGGFSAGYFNSVGTRDGWRPQQFKSSRGSKAESVIQQPQDFMDDEDTGEFGIAPTAIRTTSDYTDHERKGVKRERVKANTDGPIPGTPVLKELLRPVRETVGVTLLKKMGWRPGQGVGPRITKKEKAKSKQQNESIKTYGCSLPHEPERMVDSDSESSNDENADVTFAPNDYEPIRCKSKDNYFGIGYSGLDRRPILSGHVNLFEGPAFSVQDKNKKLSIRGQAFGVGAFEADDDDIYARDDMSQYDFNLGPEHKTKTRWSKETDDSSSSREKCLEGFVPAVNRLERKAFEPPKLPKDFKPIHLIRKSRFQPPIEPSISLENGRSKSFARHDLSAKDRAKIINDTSFDIINESRSQIDVVQSQSMPVVKSSSVAVNIISRTLNLHGREQVESERQRLANEQIKSKSSWLEKLNTKNFIKGGVEGTEPDITRSLKNLEDFKDACSASTASEPIPSSHNESINNSIQDSSISQPNNTVKPFPTDPDKQRRFEQFLNLLKMDQKEKFASIQPLSMTEWDREHERDEFEQAARLFGSSIEFTEKKFVDSVNFSNLSAGSEDIDKQMKDAAKMKMFGKLTRQRTEWQPSSIVCKRFNIPEPRVGCAKPESGKKVGKYSVFDCLNWSNDLKFQSASDTIDLVKTRKSYVESSETDLARDSMTVSETHLNICAPDNSETSGKISERERNFEATYEKVFGKGVQITSNHSEKTKDDFKSSSGQNDGDSPENLETGLSQDLSRIDNKHVSNIMTNVSKDKEEEKKDLFKAIFLSSSEDSDTETEENVDSERMKSVLIGKTLGEVNLQRNMSPPRGIFAKLDLDSLVAPVSVKDKEKNKQKENEIKKESECVDPTKISEQKNSSEQTIESQECKTEDVTVLEEPIQPSVYGPVLPSRLSRSEDSLNAVQTTSSQPQKLIFKSVVVPKLSTEIKTKGEWVEKVKVKKSKKEKKKHKHKERSKHKHKSNKRKR